MRLRVEHLGPLREADIDLSHDLIVLTGPNNTGKTWFAWTVYALMRQARVVNDASLPRGLASQLWSTNAVTFDTKTLSTIAFLLSTEVSHDVAARLPKVFAAARPFFANTELHWSQRSPAEDARYVASHTRGAIEPSDEGWSVGYEKRVGDPSIYVTLTPTAASPGRPQPAYDDAVEDLLEHVLGLIVHAVYQRPAGLTRNVVLFPTERLAVNLFARELAASRVEFVDEVLDAEANGRDPKELFRRVGRFPIPIQDSLSVASRLDVLSRDDTPFADLALDLERSLLGGSVRATEYGELHFAPAGAAVSLPVHMAASVVKSLASLTFYLRHIAREGDFLIIDEPELNLHPDAQRKVARFLGRLVHRGFKLMVSTHSDFVVRELGHLVMLHHAGEAGSALAAELGYAHDALIAPERLGVWHFEHGTATQIPVDGRGFGVRTIDDEIARMNADAQRIYAALGE